MVYYNNSGGSMKKRILIILGILIIAVTAGLIISKSPKMISADSGFDSSWSSGGSSGGSSWSSSGSDYSWSSSSSGGSSNYSGSTSFTMFDLLLIFLFIIIMCFFGSNSKTEIDKYLNLNHNLEVDSNLFSKYISIPMEQFKKDRFEDYKMIQEAWMNFDYTCLREKLSDGLYNQYEMQLNTLKVKNQKNVMKNIKYIDSVITSVKEENNHIVVVMLLRVNQNDYLEENKVCIKGSPSLVYKMKYELTFILNKKENVCPSCGNVIEDNTNICKYCRNTVSKNPNNWVMTKKEAKYQGR